MDGWPLDAPAVISTRRPLEGMQRDVGQQQKAGCHRLVAAATPRAHEFPA